MIATRSENLPAHTHLVVTDVRISDSLLSNVRKGFPSGDVLVLVHASWHRLIHHLIVSHRGGVAEASELHAPIGANLHVRLRRWSLPLLLLDRVCGSTG